MGYFIIGDRLETLPRGLLGKRRHSTERLTINVYRLSLLGRTTTMDPLTEKYYSLSPYLWCAGNPLKFIDPDGNDVAVLHYEGEHIALLISEDNKSWYYYSIN